ncbi:MAG: hypothetical protein A3G24_00130 [Betaproteobacteria bacterium RIFCSPLOWO2_12_FULL_62_13]|nr:MAG: hypothetical protein A3G24_00130 [Betaproteobacteria bacterium RIFCSPLOWO2_12_FULL_62_13]
MLKERVERLADDSGVEIPLDKPSAEILVTLSSIEIMKYPQSIVAVEVFRPLLGARDGDSDCLAFGASIVEREDGKSDNLC